jgi:hypothetical protein
MESRSKATKKITKNKCSYKLIGQRNTVFHLEQEHQLGEAQENQLRDEEYPPGECSSSLSSSSLSSSSLSSSSLSSSSLSASSISSGRGASSDSRARKGVSSRRREFKAPTRESRRQGQQPRNHRQPRRL